jgi:hypothetical protein
MKNSLILAAVAALAVFAAQSSSTATPRAIGQIGSAIEPAQIVKAGCYDDCWHSRWRSHYRWGSNVCCEGYHWHHRWRSHFRWGSYGGSGYDYHYRWGSYHRYWRERYDD